MTLKNIILTTLATALLFTACTCSKKSTNTDTSNIPMNTPPEFNNILDNSVLKGDEVRMLAPAIVYKTTKDYSKLVPIILTPDKKDIVSYPAPTDIYYNGKLAYPTPLTEGYWLDNRGINEHVAFTSYSYETYSKLKKAPTKAELMQHIVDKNPLVDIVNCGARANYKNDVEELNKLIKSGFNGIREQQIFSTTFEK